MPPGLAGSASQRDASHNLPALSLAAAAAPLGWQACPAASGGACRVAQATDGQQRPGKHPGKVLPLRSPCAKHRWRRRACFAAYTGRGLRAQGCSTGQIFACARSEPGWPVAGSRTALPHLPAPPELARRRVCCHGLRRWQHTPTVHKQSAASIPGPWTRHSSALRLNISNALAVQFDWLTVLAAITFVLPRAHVFGP